MTNPYWAIRRGLRGLSPWRIRRAVRFWWQRRTRGWDDSDMWDLYVTIARFVAPRLRRFRELHQVGFPASLIKDWEDMSANHNAVAEWHAILAKMQTAFDLLAENETKIEDQSKIDEGLKLFAEYFGGLWD